MICWCMATLHRLTVYSMSNLSPDKSSSLVINPTSMRLDLDCPKTSKFTWQSLYVIIYVNDHLLSGIPRQCHESVHTLWVQHCGEGCWIRTRRTCRHPSRTPRLWLWVSHRNFDENSGSMRSWPRICSWPSTLTGDCWPTRPWWQTPRHEKSYEMILRHQHWTWHITINFVSINATHKTFPSQWEGTFWTRTACMTWGRFRWRTGNSPTR